MQKYYVYILANNTNTTIYVGVTNNIPRRIEEHKNEDKNGFVKKYKTYKLVYNEEYSNITDAISREKQLKKWSRSKKNALIEKLNPSWADLLSL